MNSRRIFIKQAAVAAAGAALIPGFACSPAPATASTKTVGLQLYTLRDLLPKDVKGVIEKVAKAGYKEVETYGYTAEAGFWGLEAKSFKALLEANGLKAPSGHFGLEEYIKSGDKELLKPLIAGAAELNMEYFTCPFLGEDLRTSLDDYQENSRQVK